MPVTARDPVPRAVVPVGKGQRMTNEDSERYHAKRVCQELELAAAAKDPAVKIVHLNLAARYATLRERSMLPDGASPDRTDDGTRVSEI